MNTIQLKFLRTKRDPERTPLATWRELGSNLPNAKANALNRYRFCYQDHDFSTLAEAIAHDDERRSTSTTYTVSAWTPPVDTSNGDFDEGEVNEADINRQLDHNTPGQDFGGTN